METIPSESSITLVVKTPNQRVRDIEVNCLLNWTVAKLKSHLTNVYPTKPTRSSQKIIYSGKLLDDNFVLKDILLKSEGEQQAVHLVCTPSATDVNQDTSKNNSQSPDQTTVPEATSSTSFSAIQPDGLRHRHVHHTYPQHPYYHMFPSHFQTYSTHDQHGQASAQSSSSSHPHIPPNAHHFGHYAAHHMAHMQWMHHVSQMMHTMPYGQMTQSPFPYQHQVVNDEASTTPSAPAVAPVAAQENQPAEAEPARRENRERNVVMNANAGGGMMEDDEDDQENLQRDWLDHVYMIVRIIMLMSIFWFYTSPGRLVGMAVVMLILWLLQSGWLNLNRAQRNRRQAEDAPREARQEDQEDEDEDTDDGNETDSQFSETDEPDAAANATSRSNHSRAGHPGYFVVCYNFITTFFTSLVPQGPQHIGQP